MLSAQLGPKVKTGNIQIVQPQIRDCQIGHRSDFPAHEVIPVARVESSLTTYKGGGTFPEAKRDTQIRDTGKFHVVSWDLGLPRKEMQT